jgi:hypothetical protein
LWATTNLVTGFTCVPGCPTIPSGGSTTIYTNPAPASPHEFYKVRVQP